MIYFDIVVPLEISLFVITKDGPREIVEPGKGARQRFVSSGARSRSVDSQSKTRELNQTSTTRELR